MLSGLRDEEEMALHLPAADISHQSRRSLNKKNGDKTHFHPPHVPTSRCIIKSI